VRITERNPRTYRAQRVFYKALHARLWQSELDAGLVTKSGGHPPPVDGVIVIDGEEHPVGSLVHSAHIAELLRSFDDYETNWDY
jgi:hypothetical protein